MPTWHGVHAVAFWRYRGGVAWQLYYATLTCLFCASLLPLLYFSSFVSAGRFLLILLPSFLHPTLGNILRANFLPAYTLLYICLPTFPILRSAWHMAAFFFLYPHVTMCWLKVVVVLWWGLFSRSPCFMLVFFHASHMSACSLFPLCMLQHHPNTCMLYILSLCVDSCGQCMTDGRMGRMRYHLCWALPPRAPCRSAMRGWQAARLLGLLSFSLSTSLSTLNMTPGHGHAGFIIVSCSSFSGRTSPCPHLPSFSTTPLPVKFCHDLLCI